MAQGEVETVLILSPNRLARHFPYQYIVVEEFERAGCETVFTNHNFGTSPAERMLQEMTGVFAEYERAMITERCRLSLPPARTGTERGCGGLPMNSMGIPADDIDGFGCFRRSARDSRLDFRSRLRRYLALACLTYAPRLSAATYSFQFP